MNLILTFVKDYFIFMIILFLFSYLTPKENYRKYFQFFIGVLMAAILMRPVLELLGEDQETQVRSRVEEILQECERGRESYERLAEDTGLDTQKAEETDEGGFSDYDSDRGASDDHRVAGQGPSAE